MDTIFIPSKNPKHPFDGRRVKIYDYHEVDEFINNMVEKGYEAVQLRDGVLGSGDWALLSHNPKKYNFVIREIALNSWSSAHTIRRVAKVSEALQKEIDKAQDYDEDE